MANTQNRSENQPRSRNQKEMQPVLPGDARTQHDKRRERYGGAMENVKRVAFSSAAIGNARAALRPTARRRRCPEFCPPRLNVTAQARCSAAAGSSGARRRNAAHGVPMPTVPSRNDVDNIEEKICRCYACHATPPIRCAASKPAYNGEVPTSTTPFSMPKQEP